MIASVRASRKLKEIPGLEVIFPGFKEKAEVERQVSSSLQEAVYKVREQNRLERHTDEVKNVSFSSDGKIIAISQIR